MKKLFITSLLLLTLVVATGCGKKNKAVVCEQLTLNECGQYAEQCAICPDGINLPTQSCHPKPYCNNFNFGE